MAVRALINLGARSSNSDQVPGVAQRSSVSFCCTISAAWLLARPERSSISCSFSARRLRASSFFFSASTGSTAFAAGVALVALSPHTDCAALKSLPISSSTSRKLRPAFRLELPRCASSGASVRRLLRSRITCSRSCLMLATRDRLLIDCDCPSPVVTFGSSRSSVYPPGREVDGVGSLGSRVARVRSVGRRWKPCEVVSGDSGISVALALEILEADPAPLEAREDEPTPLVRFGAAGSVDERRILRFKGFAW